MTAHADPAATDLGTLTSVDSPLGAFAAVAADGVVRVRNIRYARADRFAPPVPVAPEASESADLQFRRITCPQPPSGSDGLLGDPLRGTDADEDCLRLSLTRPADVGAGDDLPVLVWVHGGSHVSGAGDLGGYDPATLVREQRVVVVTITYRLGVLGFLGDPAASPPRAANLGLLDLIVALRWVREHIGAFGGDPSLVTVFGQSSGGDAIAHVLAADGADGLVDRVILQSTPFGIRGGRAALQQRMRRAVGDLAADAPLDDVFAAQARARAAANGSGLRAGMAFSPEYGIAPLPPEADVEARWRERAPGLDVLVCWTSEEASFFVEVSPALRRLAARRGSRSLMRALVRTVTDRVYRTGGRRFADLLAASGARVQVAEFDGRPEGSTIGAAHAIDVALLFANESAWADTPLLAPDGAAALVTAGAPLRAAWAEFARTGRIAEPTVPLGPGWTGGLRRVG
ncbi:carboxylesterase family protein [Agromyces sp. MMS24-K17]|uniref:carboxylesterase family protein n=1 Tax=Agromyces sp. MMS24-K17 TaxID=3372850 RepID=UPI0037549610